MSGKSTASGNVDAVQEQHKQQGLQQQQYRVEKGLGNQVAAL
jgi:hypothetical protein